MPEVDNKQAFDALAQEFGSPARLISYAIDRCAALPPHVTLELIEAPKPIIVPGGIYFGYGLLPWQRRYIPMIDLQARLQGTRSEPHTPAAYALVVTHQREAGTPIGFGALGLATLPKTIMVQNRDVCDFPSDSNLWPSISLSCFELEGNSIPILDTARLFVQD